MPLSLFVVTVLDTVPLHRHHSPSSTWTSTSTSMSSSLSLLRSDSGVLLFSSFPFICQESNSPEWNVLAAQKCCLTNEPIFWAIFLLFFCRGASMAHIVKKIYLLRSTENTIHTFDVRTIHIIAEVNRTFNVMSNAWVDALFSFASTNASEHNAVLCILYLLNFCVYTHNISLFVFPFLARFDGIKYKFARFEVIRL